MEHPTHRSQIFWATPPASGGVNPFVPRSTFACESGDICRRRVQWCRQPGLCILVFLYPRILVYPCTSFAFNHVERREKRRLVFAKSFRACAEGLLFWIWVCLSLIINNENGGVKSCRCSMPNAGICHSRTGKGFCSAAASKGVACRQGAGRTLETSNWSTC